jgi:hypothetical protein
MLDQGIWGNTHAASSSGSFGLSGMVPGQLDEVFRQLRVDVRGPFAKPI